MAVKLVVFDIAGTTLDDSVNGLPLVTVAMADAFRKHGHDIHPDTVTKHRGLEKKDAIRGILAELSQPTGNDDSLVGDIFTDFKASLDRHLSSVKSEIPGTSETFTKLSASGIKLAVGSGFPHRVVEDIVSRLGWRSVLDYVSSAEKEGHGRPHPAMILAAMKNCGVGNPRAVVKVGDTTADIEEGKNAGCRTVAVLTGTQTEETLKSANPDFILDSVARLPELLGRVSDKPAPASERADDSGDH